MTKAETIYSELKERITQGIYPIGSRFPSELVLAQEYGINRKTANLAVAMLEKDGLVKRGIRGAGTTVVKQAVFPKGYIAFLALFNHYNNRILNGIQRASHGYGYATTVFYADSLDVVPYLESVSRMEFQGVIAAEFMPLLTGNLSCPVVLVDNGNMVNAGFFGVNTDNFRGAYDLMREILRRGHREIVLYSGRRNCQDRKDRIRGFAEAMKEAGIPDVSKRVFYGGYRDVSEADNILQKIRRNFPKTTLIACDADETTECLLQAVCLHSRRIPDDLTITSFGNTLFSIPRLATVEQQPERIGEIACSRLIESMESGKKLAPEQELVVPYAVNTDCIPDLCAHAKSR